MTSEINTHVLWDEEENRVIEISNLATVKDHIILLNKYVFRPTENDLLYKFGKWTYYDAMGKNCKNWQHVPKAKLPKEFLTNLLLLGYQI